MINIKKNIIFLGAIVIVFSMVSSTTAMIAQPTKNAYNVTNENGDNEIYVQPGVILTKMKLPKLKDAYEKIEDQEFKLVVEKIIEKLEQESIKLLTSKDIKNILVDLGLLNYDAYVGLVAGSGAGYCSAGGFPLIPLPFIFKGCLWIGPGLFVSWNAEKCLNNLFDFTVGGQAINYDHHGLALLNIGYWSSQMVFDANGFPGTGCNILVFSPLILIRPL